VASPDCFRSLTAVWLADILGLDATPVLSGPEQSPLGANRLSQAPKSIASSHYWVLLLVDRLRLDFLTTFVVFPSRRSHLAVPTGDLSHSLAFYSLTSYEVDGVLWSARYPCRVQATSVPPGCLPPTPGSCNHRNPSLPKSLLVGPVRLYFLTTFTIIPYSLLPPRGRQNRSFQALRHCFRSLSAGVARPHPRSGCYPCPSKWNSTPQPCRVPLVALHSQHKKLALFIGRMSLSPEFTAIFLDFSIPIA